MTAPGPADLAPTRFLDSDHPAVAAFVDDVTAGAADDRERAVRLFAAVRDRIRYDPFHLQRAPGANTASAVLAAGAAYCVPKSVLLAAAARGAGIPARLGFADVQNHLTTPRLQALMGSDVFVWHGYAALWLGGRWVKASPAFNSELCERAGVAPLAFDGEHDALLHAHDGRGERYMEYLADHGLYEDLPLEELFVHYDAAYPRMAARPAEASER